MAHQQPLGMTTHSQSDQTQGNDARNNDIEGQFPNDVGGGHLVNERKTPKTILDPKGEFLQSWNVIFLLSCVTSVFLDPLFFYLPVINEDKKCVGLDKKLWITAIVLRSVTDIIYLVHIILQFRTGFIDKERERLGKGLNTDAWKIAKRYLRRYFLIDILAILPIPQVVISNIFSEMRHTKSSHKMIPLNSAILLQYVPRVFQIYLSWRELIRSNEKVERTIWFKAALNFFLYLLAGHVLGAFWYFFSTQRLTSCWQKSCEIHIECIRSSFNCDHSLGNHSFLNDVCPINTPNATLFDLGIFVDALQSGIVKSSDFPQKLFYCFWWGMQNLSSLGQNLKTSNYVWENLFALSISILGLFLFLYLVGNLQMYMLFKTSRSEEIRMKMESRKRKKQKEKIDLWCSKYDFPQECEKKIKDEMKQRFKDDEDVYVENFIPTLPGKLQDDIKQHICLKLLKNLNIVKKYGWADHPKHEPLLINICNFLKPVFYNEHSYIVREGDPLDMVLLITDGIAWTYTSSCKGKGKETYTSSCKDKGKETYTSSCKDKGKETYTSSCKGKGKEISSREAEPERLEKGQFFGEELLAWVWEPAYKSKVHLPFSSRTIQTHGKVEAFALMVNDLKKIAFSSLIRLNREQLEVKAASHVQRLWRSKHQRTDDRVGAVSDAVVESNARSI